MVKADGTSVVEIDVVNAEVAEPLRLVKAAGGAPEDVRLFEISEVVVSVPDRALVALDDDPESLVDPDGTTAVKVDEVNAEVSEPLIVVSIAEVVRVVELCKELSWLPCELVELSGAIGGICAALDELSNVLGFVTNVI